MPKQTQCDRILAYMEQFGSITALDAMREFGCMRLAARIADLKGMGHHIVSHSSKVKNRFGDPVTVTEYRLEERSESKC